MTYANCASGGEMEECHDGDEDCCFVEVRETQGSLQQLCTGCKDRTACEDMKGDNFVGHYTNYQCRSDYRYQRAGRGRIQQSVCRQCFQTCDPSADSSKCFGSIATNGATPNVKFTLHSDEANFPWNNFYVGGDVDGFGIPTHAKLDSGVDSAVIGDIESFASADTQNVWFANAADGKADGSNGDSTRDNAEMTFWGLQGASMAWWTSDLKTKQSTLGAAGSFTTANFA